MIDLPSIQHDDGEEAACVGGSRALQTTLLIVFEKIRICGGGKPSLNPISFILCWAQAQKIRARCVKYKLHDNGEKS